VKSGADFPAYIRDMKSLGVKSYEHYVSDGHIQYHGANNFSVAADAKWPARKIAAQGNSEKLKNDISIHQQGKTDYPTFCMQSAETGAEKWVVDTLVMKCIYYDIEGNEMLVEIIPEV
jgi:uncharacterized protein YbcV (DUF1398 family)